jgi:CII-binding regulator of phage lambda lysogenization HflD
MFQKIKKLANKIDDEKYKISLMSIAKKLTSNDQIVVSIEELIKLVDPERVSYDSESAIGDIAVVSKDF